MSSERATLPSSVPDAGTEQRRKRGEGVDEIGAVVVDAEDDSTARDEAVVVNTPPVTLADWDVGDRTVAEDNPAYDADSEVIVVAFRDDLEDAHPNWQPPEQIALPADCRTFAFPPRRLQRVDHYRESVDDDAEANDGNKGLSPPELSEDQERLRERLEESCSVDVDVVANEAVLRVEKLGDEHVIYPDGRVEGGAIAGRLRDVVAEFLGGDTE